MNFFYHKDLRNHLLQLYPKVVKHPVYMVVPSTKSFICCVDCKLPGVSISDKTLLGALYNRDLDFSTIESIVKEQIRISGDKLYAVTHAYLNKKIAVFWVVSPVCFGET
jgi:hypothetical protein